MGELNCLRCKYRHEDNGNCTATGGFCTAVPAAHCRLLREYLDTGLTQEQCENAKIIKDICCIDGGTYLETRGDWEDVLAWAEMPTGKGDEADE